MSCEIRRMLGGRGFLAAVLLTALGIAFGASYPDGTSLLEPGSFLNLVKEALTSQTFLFLLPAAAVLPWSDSFLEEWKGGFLKSSLPRMGRRLYVESKVFATALGGILTVLLSGILMVLLFFILFFPSERRGAILPETVWGLFAVLFRAGLVGGILSSIGGICAVVSGSAYMAYGLPFVGYYFCMILKERYFEEALWLYPPEWIEATARWGEKNQGLWLFLILFLGGVMGIFGGVLYGRLEEL